VSKVNLLSPAIAIWFDCGLLTVLCCHLATENVMKLLFLAFRYVAAGAGFVVPRTTAACFKFANFQLTPLRGATITEPRVANRPHRQCTNANRRAKS